jgi:uncharacterized protein (TIGR03083 family)
MLQRVNDHERHIAAAETELARFVEVIGRADLAAPVPTCPDWTVADLVAHHGTVVRWITQVVRTLPEERIPAGDTGLPADVKEYPRWFADGVEPLLATLRATPAETPTWTFGPDRHVRFWSRRVLHETVVHRADAEIALGREPAVDRELAADGIEEFLTNYPGHPRIVGRIAELGRFGDTLHLHATDGDGEWMITLGPDGTTWARGHGKGTVAARGTTSDLLLVLYGRYAPGRVTVLGDETLLTDWLVAAAP